MKNWSTAITQALCIVQRNSINLVFELPRDKTRSGWRRCVSDSWWEGDTTDSNFYTTVLGTSFIGKRPIYIGVWAVKICQWSMSAQCLDVKRVYVGAKWHLRTWLEECLRKKGPNKKGNFRLWCTRKRCLSVKETRCRSRTSLASWVFLFNNVVRESVTADPKDINSRLVPRESFFTHVARQNPWEENRITLQTLGAELLTIIHCWPPQCVFSRGDQKWVGWVLQ